MGTILSNTGAEVQTDIDEGLNNQPKENYVWDDFSFPVGNLRVNPVTSKPDYDDTENEFLFDDASTETVVGSGITSHGFKTGVPGLEWRPHVHWIQENAGDVVWQLEYKIHCANELEPAWSAPITTTSKEFTYTSGSLHQISEFTPIDVSGIDVTACVVKVRISRVGGSGLDNYVGDARFDSFDFHVPIDQLGSRMEFIK